METQQERPWPAINLGELRFGLALGSSVEELVHRRNRPKEAQIICLRRPAAKMPSKVPYRFKRSAARAEAYERSSEPAIGPRATSRQAQSIGEGRGATRYRACAGDVKLGPQIMSASGKSENADPSHLRN
jgi:hypothetical protein